MSRILFLSQLIPFPPDAGPKVRSYYVLQHLSKKHQVTLLAFSRPDDTVDAIHHLREFCEEVDVVLLHRGFIQNLSALVFSLITGDTFTIRRDYVPKMCHMVDNLILTKHFDFIHSDQLWMAQYALRAKKISPNIKTVVDEHNACYKIFQRLASGERKSC